MNKNFKSVFKEEMEMFMNYKKSRGYECSQNVYNKYLRLDDYFYESNLKEKIINQQVIDGWFKLFEKVKESTRFVNCVSVIKSFTKFLIQNNYKNIIIPEITVKVIDFIPHIYSNLEIKLILEYAKKLKDCKSKHKNYDAYYVALYLLFGCGLRISEVFNLTLNNINTSQKILYIIKGKNNISRIVPMSDSVFNVLRDYLTQNEYDDENAKVFLNKSSDINDGKYLKSYSFREYFKKVLKHINIQKTYEGKLPRVHDIRHTFAVRALEQMEKKGIDLYASISSLSIYLGHVSIVETEKYLRLIPSVTKEINKKITDYTSNIYKDKEVYCEE